MTSKRQRERALNVSAPDHRETRFHLGPASAKVRGNSRLVKDQELLARQHGESQSFPLNPSSTKAFKWAKIYIYINSPEPAQAADRAKRALPRGALRAINIGAGCGDDEMGDVRFGSAGAGNFRIGSGPSQVQLGTLLTEAIAAAR